jgi:hypothetical protein
MFCSWFDFQEDSRNWNWTQDVYARFTQRKWFLSRQTKETDENQLIGRLGSTPKLESTMGLTLWFWLATGVGWWSSWVELDWRMRTFCLSSESKATCDHFVVVGVYTLLLSVRPLPQRACSPVPREIPSCYSLEQNRSLRYTTTISVQGCTALVGN